MKAFSHIFLRHCAHPVFNGFFLAVLFLTAALSGAPPQQTPQAYSEDEENDWFMPSNTITFSFSDLVTDNELADYKFFERAQMSDDLMFGIESVDYYYDGDAFSLYLEGQFLSGTNDFDIDLKTSKSEWGYVEFKFNSYRTPYLGAGGYFAPREWYYLLEDPFLGMDHEHIGFEIVLMRPDQPVFRIGFDRRELSGTRSSTIWGDTYNTQTTGPPRRGLVPTPLETSTIRTSYHASVEEKAEAPDWGVGLRYVTEESSQSKRIQRAVRDPDARRDVRQDEESRNDLFSVYGFHVSDLAPSVKLTTTAFMTRLDGDFQGNRIYGEGLHPVYDPGFERRQFNDQGFLDLDGLVEAKLLGGRIQVVSSLTKNWRLLGAVKLQRLDYSAESFYMDTNLVRDFNPTTSDIFEADRFAESDKNIQELSNSLELRYSGWDNAHWVLEGEYHRHNGDLHEEWKETPILPADSVVERPLLLRNSDFNRDIKLIKSAFSWFPASSFNIHLQAYYKEKENTFTTRDSYLDPSDRSLYPGFIEGQSFATYDGNIRFSWKPLQSLRLMARFDYQKSNIEGTTLSEDWMQTAQMESFIWSGSLTFMPWQRFYTQVTSQFVRDRSKTPSNEVTGFFENTVREWTNDYWNLSGNLFFIVTDWWDASLSLAYYRAENYFDNSAKTQPYGNDVEEIQGILAFFFHFNENTTWSIQYAYYDYADDFYAGLQDYEMKILTTRLQLKF